MFTALVFIEVQFLIMKLKVSLATNLCMLETDIHLIDKEIFNETLIFYFIFTTLLLFL